MPALLALSISLILGGMLLSLAYTRGEGGMKQLEAWHVKARTQYTPLAYKNIMNEYMESIQEEIDLKVETYLINEVQGEGVKTEAYKISVLKRALIYEKLVNLYTRTVEGQTPQFLVGQVGHYTLAYPLQKTKDRDNRDNLFVCFKPTRSITNSNFPREDLDVLADYYRIRRNLNSIRSGIKAGESLKQLESVFVSLEQELDKPIILLFTQGVIRERYQPIEGINTFLTRIRVRHHTITLLNLQKNEEDTHAKLVVDWMKNERTP